MSRPRTLQRLAIHGTLALFAAASLQAIAGAQATGTAVTGADQQFITQAIESGDQQIAQARLELNGVTDPGVRMYAQTIIRDHTDANAELSSLAQSLGLNVPSDTAKPTTAQPAAAYMQDEVTEHQKAIALFKGEENNGEQDIAAIASQIVPVLEKHLAMAQQYVRTGQVTPESPPSPAP